MRTLRLFAPAALLLATACAEQGITTPLAEERLPSSGGGLFSEQITLPQLQAAVGGGSVRVEVKLVSAAAPLVASEVERGDAEELTEEEKIESRVTAVGAGAVTLELGGLKVSYDATTRFRAEGGDTLTEQEFVSLLQAAIAAGERPAIEAKRPAPAALQAPGDATFLATELEIDDEAEEPKLEMNAGAANLALNADSTGTLTLLGLAIQIRPGQTELESSRPEKKAKARFEGLVRSVDVTAGTLTLLDGRVIRVVADTEIEKGDGKLGTLAEVAAALAEQKMVEAEGRGAVEGGNPPVLLARELEMKVQTKPDNVPHAAKVKGSVASVDTVARTLTLVDGRVVRIVAGTHWQQSKELSSLSAVAAALAAGDTLSLDAKTVLESAGPPAVHIALKLKLKDESKGGKGKKEKGKDDGQGNDDGGDEGEFEGVVSAADVTAGTLTLAGGRTVRLTSATVIDTDGDLLTLQAVADALTAGKKVKAEGEGSVVVENGVKIVVATKVEFELED